MKATDPSQIAYQIKKDEFLRPTSNKKKRSPSTIDCHWISKAKGSNSVGYETGIMSCGDQPKEKLYVLTLNGLMAQGSFR